MHGGRSSGAREFADGLARFRKGEPVLARPRPFAARLWRRAMRHRRGLLPAAADTIAPARGRP